MIYIKLFLLVAVISLFSYAVISIPEEPIIVVKERVVEITSRDVNIPITVSVYQALEEQTDNEPKNCACEGFVISEKSHYIWVAVSRDLLRDYLNCGDTIIVVKNGSYYEFIVADVMASNWLRKIDIVIPENIIYTNVYKKDSPLYTLFKEKGKAEIKKILHNVGEKRKKGYKNF